MHEATQKAFTDELSVIQKEAGVGKFLSKGFGHISELLGGKTTLKKLYQSGKTAYQKGAKGKLVKTKAGRTKMKGGKEVREGGGILGGIKGAAGSRAGLAAGAVGGTAGIGYAGARATD